MPSTRISTCLICASDAGARVEAKRINSASFRISIVPPSLFSQNMKSKLLRDSETDMAPHRHEHRACRMCNIPIHSHPNVHTRTNSRVSRDSRKQHVATASVLRHSRDPVVLRVQPGERGPDEPFASYVLRFVRAI